MGVLVISNLSWYCPSPNLPPRGGDGVSAQPDSHPGSGIQRGTDFSFAVTIKLYLTIRLTNNLKTSGSLDVKDAAQTAHIEKNIVELPGSQATGGPKIPRKPFAVRLNPYSATYTDEPIWKLVFSPFIILYHPVVMWAVALMAFPTLWLVAINLLTTQIFAAPPYLLSVAELGYFAAGPTVGGLLGALAAGGLSDIVIKLLIKTNNGVYEPEFRLFVIVPAVVLSIVGYFPFGRLIAQGASPVAMSTLYGVVTAALQFIMTVVGTYVVDAYPEIGVETFIATMIIKNFLFFGFSCKFEPSPETYA